MQKWWVEKMWKNERVKKYAKLEGEKKCKIRRWKNMQSERVKKYRKWEGGKIWKLGEWKNMKIEVGKIYIIRR